MRTDQMMAKCICAWFAQWHVRRVCLIENLICCVPWDEGAVEEVHIAVPASDVGLLDRYEVHSPPVEPLILLHAVVCTFPLFLMPFCCVCGVWLREPRFMLWLPGPSFFRERRLENSRAGPPNMLILLEVLS